MCRSSVKSALMIAALSACCSLSAGAAYLDVQVSNSLIAPGDPLSVSVLGDSEGETSFTIVANLAYTGTVTPSDATGPFELLRSIGYEWEPTALMGRCGLEEDPPSTCRALDAFTQFSPADLLLSTFSTFEFDTSAALPGSVLTFQAVPAGGIGFFSAGPSEVVTVQVIPEPAAGLLVALGLLALGGRARTLGTKNATVLA